MCSIFIWELFSEAIPVRELVSMRVQREKLKCDTVATGSSADLWGVWAGMTLQSCPKLRKRSKAFVSPH